MLFRSSRLFGRTLIEEEVVIQNLSGTVGQFLDSQSLTFLGVLTGVVIAVGFGFGVIAFSSTGTRARPARPPNRFQAAAMFLLEVSAGQSSSNGRRPSEAKK